MPKEAYRRLQSQHVRLQQAHLHLERKNRQLADAMRRLREAKARIERHAEELARSNKDFEDFSHAASHDMRAPLRHIKQYATLLLKAEGEKLSEPGRKRLGRMGEAADRLSIMIESLLDYAKVNVTPQALQPVDLHQVAEQVIEDLEPVIRAAKASVDLGSLPTVAGEPSQMYQVLLNLIGNALKYHEPESSPVVVIQSKVVAPVIGGEDSDVEISVEDNGIGFDESAAGEIFAPFRRLVAHSEYEGSGIGLSTVRRIVERHHGSVRVRSTPGQGSTFTVVLPQGETEPTDFHVSWKDESRLLAGAFGDISEPHAQDGPPSSFPPMTWATAAPMDGTRSYRVLVVDDNPEDRELVAEILGAAFEISTEDSAEAALSALSNCKVDVVLSDFDMPYVDGFQLLSEIKRQYPKIRRLLTSNAKPKELDSHLRSGLVHSFLAKPVTVEGLRAHLGEKLGV